METNLTLQQMSVYNQMRKSTGVGYILLVLLGGFGVHRLWLRQYLAGLFWIAATFFIMANPYSEFQLVYLAFYVFELITFYQQIREYNEDVAKKLVGMSD